MFMTIKKVKNLFALAFEDHQNKINKIDAEINSLKNRINYLESELGIKQKPKTRVALKKKTRRSRTYLLPSAATIFESTGRTYMTRSDLNSLMMNHGWKHSTAYQRIADAVESQELIETASGKLKLMKVGS